MLFKRLAGLNEMPRYEGPNYIGACDMVALSCQWGSTIDVGSPCKILPSTCSACATSWRSIRQL